MRAYINIDDIYATISRAFVQQSPFDVSKWSIYKVRIIFSFDKKYVDLFVNQEIFTRSFHALFPQCICAM